MTTITADDLSRLLYMEVKIGCLPQLDDKQYVIPTRRWFIDEFPTILKRDFFDAVIPAGYEKEKMDCENMTMLAVGYAGICHNASCAKPYGITIGEFHYVVDSTGLAHALVIGITHSKGQRYADFLEVTLADPKIVKLSEKEVRSSSWCRFC